MTPLDIAKRTRNETIKEVLNIINGFGNKWQIAQETDETPLEYIDFDKSEIFKQLKLKIKNIQSPEKKSKDKNASFGKRELNSTGEKGSTSKEGNPICICGDKKSLHYLYDKSGVPNICWSFMNCECKKFEPKVKK